MRVENGKIFINTYYVVGSGITNATSDAEHRIAAVDLPLREMKVPSKKRKDGFKPSILLLLMLLLRWLLLLQVFLLLALVLADDAVDWTRCCR